MDSWKRFHFEQSAPVLLSSRAETESLITVERGSVRLLRNTCNLSELRYQSSLSDFVLTFTRIRCRCRHYQALNIRNFYTEAMYCYEALKLRLKLRKVSVSTACLRAESSDLEYLNPMQDCQHSWHEFDLGFRGFCDFLVSASHPSHNLSPS
jgi:hypothetical protein